MEADRKIVRQLVKETLYKEKHRYINILLKTLDKYKITKTDSEFNYLTEILKEGFRFSRKRALEDINALEEELKSKHSSKKIPWERSVEMKILQDLKKDYPDLK